MEMEAMRQMLKRWEGDQKVAAIVKDQDSKIAKAIRKFRRNVAHEYGTNHVKKGSTAITKTFQIGATAALMDEEASRE
jgi:hypothetical protein